MKHRRPHPDFSSDPDHQWLGTSLASLLTALTIQLGEKADNAVYRVLSGGMVVSLTRDEGGRRVLTLRRRSAFPRNPKELGKFLSEVDKYRAVMKITSWVREQHSTQTSLGVRLIESN